MQATGKWFQYSVFPGQHSRQGIDNLIRAETLHTQRDVANRSINRGHHLGGLGEISGAISRSIPHI